MKIVFADSLYWIATVRPHDPWRTAARTARALLGDVRIVTTGEVLAEMLTALSKAGPAVRRTGVALVRAILESPDVEVVPQSHGSFLQALDRYARREDKQYSFADCASMNAMDSAGIKEILTHDRHFEQEGYTALIKSH